MISNPHEMHLTNKDDEKYIKIYYSSCGFEYASDNGLMHWF